METISLFLARMRLDEALPGWLMHRLPVVGSLPPASHSRIPRKRRLIDAIPVVVAVTLAALTGVVVYATIFWATLIL